MKRIDWPNVVVWFAFPALFWGTVIVWAVKLMTYLETMPTARPK